MNSHCFLDISIGYMRITLLDMTRYFTSRRLKSEIIAHYLSFSRCYYEEDNKQSSYVLYQVHWSLWIISSRLNGAVVECTDIQFC